MAKAKRKKSALIICRNDRQFWTTQKQFWSWVRSGVLVKTKDLPLTGVFAREDEERFVLIKKQILNLAQPVHLREVLDSKRLMKPKKN